MEIPTKMSVILNVYSMSFNVIQNPVDRQDKTKIKSIKL